MAGSNQAPYRGWRRPCPSAAEQEELLSLSERFDRHHVFWGVIEGRGIRYTAQGTTLDAHPHTIITTDLAELRRELEQASRQESCTAHERQAPSASLTVA